MRSFDLLVVDIEGFEREVFSGFTVGRWQPQMMIIELSGTPPHVDATRRSDTELSREIRNAGYEVVFKDAISTIFVREDLVRSAIG